MDWIEFRMMWMDKSAKGDELISTWSKLKQLPAANVCMKSEAERCFMECTYKTNEASYHKEANTPCWNVGTRSERGKQVIGGREIWNIDYAPGLTTLLVLCFLGETMKKGWQWWCPQWFLVTCKSPSRREVDSTTETVVTFDAHVKAGRRVRSFIYPDSLKT